MKNITRTLFHLQMAALLVTAALACPTAPHTGVPFRGSLELAQSVRSVESPSVFVDGVGTGSATHLGEFASVWEHEINVITDVAIGSVVFKAANGDTLSAEITGFGAPTGTPDVRLITETLTITGGTGRFAGATGSVTLGRLINLLTGISTGSFDGTIVLTSLK